MISYKKRTNKVKHSKKLDFYHFNKKKYYYQLFELF